MQQDNFDVIKYTFEESIPLHKFLGLKIVELDQRSVKIVVPFKNELVGDFRTNRWHGGIIAAIMDSVGGIIGATYFTTLEDKIATIDLRIDYIKGAEPEELVVVGKIVNLGIRILVAKMKAFQNDHLIAEGKGVYNFVRMKDSTDQPWSSGTH